MACFTIPRTAATVIPRQAGWLSCIHCPSIISQMVISHVFGWAYRVGVVRFVPPTRQPCFVLIAVCTHSHTHTFEHTRNESCVAPPSGRFGSFECRMHPSALSEVRNCNVLADSHSPQSRSLSLSLSRTRSQTALLDAFSFFVRHVLRQYCSTTDVSHV